MDNTEIKVNELIVESINKLIGKYQKKADKEREKAKQAYVTYKGDEYYTKDDIMDAYACDCITEATCDRLLDKLDKAMCGTLNKEMTENERIILILNQHKGNLLNEIINDRNMKKRQAEKDNRMKELMDEGYSYREAETIIGNEELMRYE